MMMNWSLSDVAIANCELCDVKVKNDDDVIDVESRIMYRRKIIHQKQSGFMTYCTDRRKTIQQYD